MAWLLACGLLLLMGCLLWLRRRGPPQMPSNEFRVNFDEKAIAVTDNFGDRQEVLWDDLQKVSIRTTDDGPGGADVFWGLESARSDRVLVFPSGAEGERELLAAMGTRLAGFNHEEVLLAMGSTTDALFVVWPASVHEIASRVVEDPVATDVERRRRP